LNLTRPDIRLGRLPSAVIAGPVLVPGHTSEIAQDRVCRKERPSRANLNEIDLIRAAARWYTRTDRVPSGSKRAVHGRSVSLPHLPSAPTGWPGQQRRCAPCPRQTILPAWVLATRQALLNHTRQPLGLAEDSSPG